LLPVARAKRSSVRVEGFTRPPSSRAITVCVVFIRRASAACVRPARERAEIIAVAKANSPSISS
jgi:hypothetical protein